MRSQGVLMSYTNELDPLKFRRLLASDELDRLSLDGTPHLVHQSPTFPCKQLLSGLIESIAPVSEHVP